MNEKVRKEKECEVRWEKVTWGKISSGRRTEVEKEYSSSNSTVAIISAFILLLELGECVTKRCTTTGSKWKPVLNYKTGSTANSRHYAICAWACYTS